MTGHIIKLILLLALIVAAFYLFYSKEELTNRSLVSTNLDKKSTNKLTVPVTIDDKLSEGSISEGKKADKKVSQESLHTLKNAIQNVIDDSVQDDIQEAVEKKIRRSKNTQ